MKGKWDSVLFLQFLVNLYFKIKILKNKGKESRLNAQDWCWGGEQEEHEGGKLGLRNSSRSLTYQRLKLAPSHHFCCHYLFSALYSDHVKTVVPLLFLSYGAEQRTRSIPDDKPINLSPLGVISRTSTLFSYQFSYYLIFRVCLFAVRGVCFFFFNI